MAVIKKMITESDIGNSLSISGNKLNVKTPATGGGIKLNPQGELTLDQATLGTAFDNTFLKKDGSNVGDKAAFAGNVGATGIADGDNLVKASTVKAELDKLNQKVDAIKPAVPGMPASVKVIELQDLAGNTLGKFVASAE